MKLKFLSIFLSLLIANTLMADPAPYAACASEKIFKYASCDVPAPDNFHPGFTGPDWAVLNWDYQTNAVGGYRVRTYKSSNNALVDTQILPQNITTVTINGLVSGESYYSVINSRCVDGVDSDDNHISEGYNTLILELVVSGFQGISNNGDCFLAPDLSCLFDGSPTQPSCFRIKKGADELKFGMSKVPNGSPSLYRCDLPNTVNDQKFFFYCNGNYLPNPNCFATTITIKYLNAPAAEFTVEQSGTAAKMTCISLAYGYELAHLMGYSGTGSGGRSPEELIGSLSESNDSWAVVQPNPFTESLTVLIRRTGEGPVELSLFDLSGQMIDSWRYTGGQEQYNLPTEKLSPGFYMLRVDMDGKVQTLKVVKSE